MKHYTPLYDLDSSSLAHVALLADSTTPTGIHAQALLTLNNDTMYWRIPESLPYIGGNLRIGLNTPETEDVTKPYLRVQPNPTNGMIRATYSLPAAVEGGILMFYDLLGRCVYSIPISANTNNIFIDLTELHPGNYYCRMISQGLEPIIVSLVILAGK